MNGVISTPLLIEITLFHTRLYQSLMTEYKMIAPMTPHIVALRISTNQLGAGVQVVQATAKNVLIQHDQPQLAKENTSISAEFMVEYSE